MTRFSLLHEVAFMSFPTNCSKSFDVRVEREAPTAYKGRPCRLNLDLLTETALGSLLDLNLLEYSLEP